MPAFEYRTTIRRSTFDVFNFVSDFSNYEKWRPQVINVSVREGDPLRVGSMVAETRRLMGRTSFVNADIVDYDRNKKITLKGSYNNFPFTRTITIQHHGAGECLVIDEINIRVGWMIWNNLLLNLSLKNQLAQEWENLKQIMETRQD